MSFDLFGIDWIPSDSIYGFWLLSVNNWEDGLRSLFGVHLEEGYLRFNILYMEFGFEVV